MTASSPVTNVSVAIEVLTGLLEIAQQIGSLIATAQSSGTDITAAQLATLAQQYTDAAAQLQADIASAQAAGK